MKENITNVDTSINDRLKQIRETLDLTQKDFSQILEVKQSYYSDVENGKREVSAKLIKNLVIIFSFSANWIFTGLGDMHITKVDNLKSTQSKNNDWDIHRSINAGQNGIYEESSNIPFYLDLHIDKKLIIDMLNLDNDAQKMYNAINYFTTFSIIIESIDRQYFSQIRLAEKSRNKFYRDNKFDFDGFIKSINSEIEKVIKFKPALEKVNAAIQTFYSDIKNIDEHNVVDGFYGRDQRTTPKNAKN